MGAKHLLINGKQDSDPPSGGNYGLAMHMSAHDMSRKLSGPAWITSVNRIATLEFAVLALYWACRYFAERRTNLVPQAAQPTRLQPLHQAVTAAGTALMCGALP